MIILIICIVLWVGFGILGAYLESYIRDADLFILVIGIICGFIGFVYVLYEYLQYKGFNMIIFKKRR